MKGELAVIIIRKFSRDEARAAAKLLNAFDQKKSETTKSILERGCQGVFNGSKRITGLIDSNGNQRPTLFILRKQDDSKAYVAGVISRLGCNVDAVMAFSS